MCLKAKKKESLVPLSLKIYSRLFKGTAAAAARVVLEAVTNMKIMTGNFPPLSRKFLFSTQ
jgi:hypothetical protein